MRYKIKELTILNFNLFKKFTLYFHKQKKQKIIMNLLKKHSNNDQTIQSIMSKKDTFYLSTYLSLEIVKMASEIKPFLF